ncbi:hypothetical protein T01_8411 [Trichinella spiralis]|uniref:Uncharacterized protein n=1 Tax=Trichinella spiralis TaxID=6334 RepID=A0A0V1BTC3_TRISP|nr:hypothetical protein T01_8411 [Trichinella spiralis]
MEFNLDCYSVDYKIGEKLNEARLAQSVEHGTLNPRVVGSSPTSGVTPLMFKFVVLYRMFIYQPTASSVQDKCQVFKRIKDVVAAGCCRSEELMINRLQTNWIIIVIIINNMTNKKKFPYSFLPYSIHNEFQYASGYAQFNFLIYYPVKPSE